MVQKPAASRMHSHLDSPACCCRCSLTLRYVPPYYCRSLSRHTHSHSRHHHTLFIPCSSHASVRTTASSAHYTSHPQSFVHTRHVFSDDKPTLAHQLRQSRSSSPTVSVSRPPLDTRQHDPHIQDPERRLSDSQRHGSVKILHPLQSFDPCDLSLFIYDIEN
jgi:hypothetical protein